MADWFEGLDFETEARWSYATFFFDYRIWANHNAVKARVNEKWPDDSAGDKLNRVGRIERAAASITAFEAMVLDSSIWVLGPSTVKKEYKKAEAAWIEGCQQWFGGNGEIPRMVMNEDGEDVEFEEVVSFGPWCIWLKPKWETLVHNFELYLTKQRLDREADQAREKTAPRILPGSGDDEEEMKEQDMVDDHYDDNHNHRRNIRRDIAKDKGEMEVDDESDHGIERQQIEKRKKKKQVRIRENPKKAQRKKKKDQDSDYFPSDRYTDLNGSDDEAHDNNIFRESSTDEELSDTARSRGRRTKRKKDLRYLSTPNSNRSNNHNVRSSRKSKSHSHQKRHSRSRSRSRSRDNHRERERRDRKSRSRHRSRHSKSRKSKSKSTQSNYRLSVSDTEEATDEV